MSGKMEKIDPNFKIAGVIPEGTTFYDARQNPFEIYGLAPDPEGRFLRFPASLFPQCSEELRELAFHLAGGCVRFSTDADQLSVLWELTEKENMPHFAASGQSGLDLYEESDAGIRLVKTFLPRMDGGCGCLLNQTGVAKLPGGRRSYALYLPLYNGLKQLMLGVGPGFTFSEGRKPKLGKPLVFYGSSVTQGGCAMKPASAYPAILGRRFDAPVINLGFSGNGKGEEFMARYIATLDMSAFILDYDYNAPTTEHLAATHEPFYRIVREAHPDLPILMASKSDVDADPERTPPRRKVILNTYYHALEAGDKNVYFLDGSLMFGNRDREMCTVDGAHPTDLGFLRMADFIEPVLRRALGE